MSSTAYPRIGQVDGDRTGIIEIPTVDSALWSAPTGDATWTKHIDNATTAAELVMQDAGYIEIDVAGTVYRIAVYTST
jgi:hypothetical protein